MKIHKIIQYITLTAFLLLMVYSMKEKGEPLLITLMLLLSAGSIVYGKLFCGYFCPFHAFDKAWGAILSKLGIKRVQTPSIFKKAYVWVPIATLMLALLIVKASAPYTHIKIKFPILLVAFVVLAIFAPALWHRYLCPFNLIMKLPSIFRVGAPTIDQSSCNHCKLCKKTCPTGAIIEKEKNKIIIEDSNCILCYQCEDVCKQESIKIRGT